jgi:hypothetical protein
VDHLWIGGLKANDVSGTIGFGQVCLAGMRTVSKDNVGNGTITGDFGHLVALVAMVHDPDVWDCPLTATGAGGKS